MIAYITHSGERTIDLCEWSLKRNGFETKILSGIDSLAKKLKDIYNEAEEDFIRIDADVIVNKWFIPNWQLETVWWLQFETFDWYQQRKTTGGVNFIRKEAIPYLRDNIDKAINEERPETYMYRLKEFHNPRRCITQEGIVGIHGYGIKEFDYVIKTKERRNQLDNYDFKLVEKLYEL